MICHVRVQTHPAAMVTQGARGGWWVLVFVVAPEMSGNNFPTLWEKFVPPLLLNGSKLRICLLIFIELQVHRPGNIHCLLSKCFCNASNITICKTFMQNRLEVEKQSKYVYTVTSLTILDTHIIAQNDLT